MADAKETINREHMLRLASRADVYRLLVLVPVFVLPVTHHNDSGQDVTSLGSNLVVRFQA